MRELMILAVVQPRCAPDDVAHNAAIHHAWGQAPGTPSRDPVDHGDAMMLPMDAAIWLVSDDSTCEVRVGAGASARQVRVTLSLDGRDEWTFDQPAWRPLSFGCGAGVSYLWSARSVVVLPRRVHEELVLIDVDEDLLFAFRRGERWVLVCETSIRLLAGDKELSRVELGEVVGQARWESGALLVVDVEGGATLIRLEGDRLVA